MGDNRKPKTSGSYAGRPDSFVIEIPHHACESARTYQLNGRPCTDWERPVLDRAYARLAEVEAALMTVAGR